TIARSANVLSYHYDLQSTGQDLTEATLTPAMVDTFRRRWVHLTDGYIYAQPLYMEGTQITAPPHAGVHNTVFVATEHDSLYALDSETGQLLWHTSLLRDGIPGAITITPVPSKDTETHDLVPEVGITGTPVIDSTNGFLYAVAKTKQILARDPSHPRWVQTLFKISIADGGILASNIYSVTYRNQGNFIYRTADDPSAAQDPFAIGAGDGSITVNNQNRVYFNALREMDRPGTVLYNGALYIAYGSHGDNGPYHGWFLSFDAATLALNGAFNATPNGSDGGIWQSGGIPTVDGSGYFYFMTGNGSFDGNPDGNGGVTGLDNNGFPNQGNYGDCFLKLSLDPTTSQANQGLNGWGFQVLDYFAPMDNQTLAANDSDLGSGGVMVLPDSAGSGDHPHLLIGSGKEGKIYLVDRDNMGKYSPYTDNVLASPANLIGGSFSTPAYFNGNIYWIGIGNSAQIFPISDAVLSGSASSQSSDSFSWPGATPTITASGTSNALLWALDYQSRQLRVYDAQDLTQEYWTSDMAPHHRDQLGPVVKFSTPTVAGGMVFVGTTKGVYAYGGAPPPTAPPAAPGGLTGYALSGTAIQLSWVNHAANQDGFAIEDSTNGVTYTQVATTGANVTAATEGNLAPSSFYFFRVRAFNSFSGTSYSTYSNAAGASTFPTNPSLDFSGGFAGSNALLNYEGSASLASGSVAQLTDGGGNEAGAVWSRQPQNIQRFDTACVFQILPDNDGFADGLTFCVQNISPTVVGGNGGYLGYSGIKKSIAIKIDVYPDLSTTGLYENGEKSDNGAPPAIPTGAAGINFASGDLFTLHLTYLNGTLTETIGDTVTNAVFTHAYQVSIPDHLGSTSGYAGFTGGTGGATSIQQILAWNFTTLPFSVPAAPTALKAAPASNTQVDLTWKDNSSSASGYLVDRRQSTGSDWISIAFVPSGTLAYNDTGLYSGTRYYYIVRAANAVGSSAPSNIARTTTPGVPAPLATLDATAVTANSITLEWTDPAPNVNTLILTRQLAGTGRHEVIARLPGATRAYTDRTAAAGARYTYRIQGSNLAGESPATAVEVTVPSR
ncbi:MAG TPA: fibronectin type III domain-containing protein, partial [Chthoniobacteraceae bacterium]|nr:fibronectin type III domain-containing protein [Chthoniobacteraceae bacterium]